MVSKHQPRRIQFTVPDDVTAHNGMTSLHTRTEVMKPAHIFRDQVNTVAQWFDQWNDIEQTIACYSLLKRLGPTQARFLSLVLDHTFSDSASEVQELEKEANCEEFLKGLCHESKEVAVQQLLFHLPLLHPGNDDARHEYLLLLPKILSHSLEYSIHEEECRQLLSLALVHPAFVPEERNSLTWWLGLLEDKGECMKENVRTSRPPPGFNTAAINMHSPLSATRSACEIYSRKAAHPQHALVTNTLSYKGGSGGIPNNRWKPQSQLAHTDSGIGSSFDNGLALAHAHNKKGNRDILEDIFPRPNAINRPKPFPAVDPHAFHHAKVSPASSIDSDDENFLQKKNSIYYVNPNNNPGMQDVPIWLKSLRLHKYAYIFENMTYEEMLGLNEDYLTEKEVTKGARKKIIVCIQKMKERYTTLQQLEKDVLQLGSLPQVLTELKAILMSPIKPPINNLRTESSLDESCEFERSDSTASESIVSESTISEKSESGNEIKTEEGNSSNSETETDKENVENVKSSEPVVEKTEKEDITNKTVKVLVDNDEDLPAEITRVMGKTCTQILVSQPDEECCLTFLGLLDRVLTHEAFNQSHKRRFQSWKGQCQKLARQLATNRKIAGIDKGPKNWYDPLGNGNALGKRRSTSRTNSLKTGSLAHLQLSRAGPLVAAHNMHAKLTPTASYNDANRSGHQALNRTKSAPIKSNVLLQQPPFSTAPALPGNHGNNGSGGSNVLQKKNSSAGLTTTNVAM